MFSSRNFNGILSSILFAAPALCPGADITVRNNQPFSWRMPVQVHAPNSEPGPWLSSDGQPVQRLNGDMLFIASMGPASSKTTSLTQAKIEPKAATFTIKPSEHGVRLAVANQDLGRLDWSLEMHPVKKGETNATEDFDANFKPLDLDFRPTSSGPVLTQWKAAVTNAGLELQIELLAFADGFLDINTHLTNASADAAAKVYAAVVCRWEKPLDGKPLVCYDNHLLELEAADRTPFRSGTGRQQFVQRGVDWAELAFKGGAAARWLNDFAPSFTVIDNTTNNPLHAPRYAGANLSQLGQEIQTVPGRFLSVTEIARANTKTFADRLTENILPPRGEGVSFSSRVAFGNAGLTDQAFIAYAGYSEQRQDAKGTTLSVGTPSSRFGTSYFPYSTLGENFDTLKLPGMDRESFWPLAADTVLQWRLFADDIRRDLRIAKAMGFQLIRLHHLELLAPIPEKTRRDYLDFLFGELRHLHLKALSDIYASPEQLAALVGRYRDVVDSVELENEVLIWGIPLDRPPQWNADYDAIKKVAPEIKVSLAGYNNTGMFDRLKLLGVKFDRIDLHSYIDSTDAIPSGRGYALALGSYGRKNGKSPLISEWNWRGLTKMSETARAEIYPPIIENVLATRSIPDFYEFQFNETLAPNPRLGRGNLLRHYELLNLSRRPKLEALEFMQLIARYSAPDDPVHLLAASHETVEAHAQNSASVNISVTNLSSYELKLRAAVEATDGLTANLRNRSSLTIPAGQAAIIPLDVVVTNHAPGFYHVFVRLESGNDFLRYLWAEVRAPGTPQVAPGPESFDFSKPVVVSYSPKANVLEVETAFAIGQTLENATGRVVPIEPIDEVPDAAEARLIYVGIHRSGQEPGKDWLLITGKNTREVEDAGMNFVLRYWKFAKDSAARRVGLARKDLPRGVDAAKLP
jgi:hypothetical protein